MLPLVLASTSPFRAALLGKLGLPFETWAPDIDETPLPEEAPGDMVRRLTRNKARAAIEAFPEHLIIASDQCAVLDDEILGKPGNHDNAVAQLTRFAGRKVSFLTGLCLLNSASGEEQLTVEPFHVHFRRLTPTQIDNYLRAETPYHCAGSFKSEGLGITLFERLEGDDPNSLIGLPLIRLTDFLANEGILLPLPPD
ncbi:MAG TPA: septum formation inhibitor Maf [Gammaproteobacteria bacterium]|nr:septum formation inhibitor Maf [Gammaproteobacteria bacterium]